MYNIYVYCTLDKADHNIKYCFIQIFLMVMFANMFKNIRLL